AESVLSKVEVSKEALGTEQLTEALQAVNVRTLAEELEVGQVTLQDIIDTLQKPNRDPRDAYPQPLLKSDILEIQDLYVGLEMQETVRNVVDFGAFIDIGVSDDGLVNISCIRYDIVNTT